MIEIANTFGGFVVWLWLGYIMYVLVGAIVNYINAAATEREALAERHTAIAERIGRDA